MSVDPASIGYPIAGRPKDDPRKIDGVKGGENLHGLMAAGKSLYDVALQEAGGKPAKKANEPTVGTKEFDAAKSALDFVKKIDPKNLAGVVPQSLDMMKQLQSQMGAGPQMLTNMLGSKIGELLKQIPMLQQLGNLDMLGQVQGMLSQELSKLPIPSQLSGLQNIANISNITNNIPNLQNMTGPLTDQIKGELTTQIKTNLDKIKEIPSKTEIV